MTIPSFWLILFVQYQVKILRVYQLCIIHFKIVSFDSNQERHLGSDKSKWSSVKHYFCGDEFNSILAEDSFSSLRSTEATAIQSAEKVSGEEAGSRLRQTEEQIDQITKEEVKLKINLSNQEKAVIIIQSAFRSFRVAT